LRAALLAGAVISAAALTFVGAAAHGGATAHGAAASTAGSMSYTVSSGGHLRTYIVYSPATRASSARPLVLVYHGALDTAANTQASTDFDQIAAARGVIIAFMQGYDDTWNEGAGHTPAEVAGIDDVAFTAAALHQIESRYKVDRTRIAAAGFSNGALMVELLGCRLAADLTAIVPVEGQLPVSVSPGCKPARPISVFEVHGSADTAIPYGGGPFAGVGGGTTVLSAPASAARWAALDGCRSAAATSKSGASTFATYPGCRGGVAVTLDTIAGGTHSWPSNVGTLVASFLASHPASRAAASA